MMLNMFFNIKSEIGRLKVSLYLFLSFVRTISVAMCRIASRALQKFLDSQLYQTNHSSKYQLNKPFDNFREECKCKHETIR